MTHMTISNNRFNIDYSQADRLVDASERALREALNVKPGEQVLIMSNPDPELTEIAKSVYNAALELDARPVLMFQGGRSRLDLAEPATLGAIASEPEVLFTITQESLGNDPTGLHTPYRMGSLTFNHIFYYLIASRKARGAWCPSANLDIYCRAVPINYPEMWDRARRLKKIFDRSEAIRVTSPGGTDFLVDMTQREGMLDDGDYRFPGSGGNLPAGEVFAVPNTGSHGKVVIDGSAAVVGGTIKISEPVTITIEKGKFVSIEGGRNADQIKATLEQMRISTEKQVESGVISRDQAQIYRKNCDNLAEFGVGLNPAAVLSGNMTEDEKVFQTCHIAMGDDCYGIAPAVDHFDMVILNPAFEFQLDDGSRLKVDPEDPPVIS
jgi:aminopeptidase